MSEPSENSDDARSEARPAEVGQRRGREESRLDFEIAFLGGILERAPFNVTVLRVHADNLAARGLAHRALQLDRRIVRLLPDRPRPWYNLACSYAVAGLTELAIAALHRAVDLGYRRLRKIERDRDLESIRSDPRYRSLVRGLALALKTPR